MPRLISGCLVAAGLALSLGGCLGDGGDNSEGKRLFGSADCGDCHTLADAGSKGMVGPSLDSFDPDLRGIIRQVTHGGQGMPAYNDRLTAAEIIEVANYVDSVAGKEPNEFEPDDTTLLDCFADPPCYAQAFGNLAYEMGPEVALARFEREMSRRRFPAVSGGCHRIGHAIGAAALARFDGSVGRAFAAGSETCGSGYYHGIVEQGLAGTERDELRVKAVELCSERFVSADGYLSYQCLHGLGHGLMLNSRNDLPFALKACDQLASPLNQRACTGGAFMENFISVGSSSKWIKPNDLLYPCDSVAERHKYFCYFFVTMRILPQVGNDQRRAASICRKAERGWVGVCFRSFGREVLRLGGFEGADAVRSCRLAGRMERDCIYGAGLGYVIVDRALRRVTNFCGTAPPAVRASCYGGLGAGVGLLYRNAERRRSACRSVTSDYVRDCVENAATPVSGPLPTPN